MTETGTGRVEKPRRKVRDAARLTKADWVLAARDALIKGGHNAVKIDVIAKRLQVTRGSFYWHFDSHAELLEELLKLWHAQNTAPFEAVARDTTRNGRDKYLAIVNLWLEETDFDPAFDAAVRGWAGASRKVRADVTKVDEDRMRLLESVFVELGFPQPEALIRARVTYFHQVGYYALAVKETKKTRREYLPLYNKILAGMNPGEA